MQSNIIELNIAQVDTVVGGAGQQAAASISTSTVAQQFYRPTTSSVPALPNVDVAAFIAQHKR